MDYLVIEGYRDAAEKFSRESGLESADTRNIEERVQVRHAIHSGDIETAIALLNDLNSDILDKNPVLYFHLQQQRFIELIRQGKVADALWFAQSELAPRAEENPSCIAELEQTMALLAFDLPGSSAPPTPATKSKSKSKADEVSTTGLPPALHSLLTSAQRVKTAREVNEAILVSLGQGPTPRLPGLLKILGWGEERMRQRNIIFPRLKLAALLKQQSEPSVSSTTVTDMEL